MKEICWQRLINFDLKIAERFYFCYLHQPIEIMKSRRSWSQKEDEAFANLTKEVEPKNWSLIAKRLASEYGFKRRSGKQCRQRWYNHLIPGISKKIWSKAQEQKLLQLHKEFGNKWTIIAEQMPGRTDNSIKNYFYSTVRRSLRRMGKLIGSKNSTSLMRSIKPSTLTQIFSVISEEKLEIFQQQLQQQFFGLQNLKKNCEKVRDEIIQFSSYKPKKSDQIDEQQKMRYERVFQIILKLNSVYEKYKGFQRNKKSQEQIFKENFKQMMKEDSEEPEGISQQDSNSDSNNQLEVIPQLIKTRTTRTRNIKIPEKLSSLIVSKQLPICQSHPTQRQVKQINLEQIKQQIYEQQLSFIADPRYENQIQEIESGPNFQIQLKDQNSFSYHLQSFDQSPRFNFGMSNDQINFFKSPLAAVSRIGYYPFVNLQQYNKSNENNKQDYNEEIE